METQVKWAASLSNGETVYEDKGDYKIIKGELSPWQRLLIYLEKQGVRVTSLSLYMDDGRRWNLPSAGRNPKFKEFADAEKPVEYKFFRKAGMDMDFDGGNRKTEIYTVAEAIYEESLPLNPKIYSQLDSVMPKFSRELSKLKKIKKLQIWVLEENPNICWSVII